MDQHRNDLIRDIGRSIRSPGTPRTSEQQLLRLADDPLLVRDFIQRAGPEGSVINANLPLGSEAVMALAMTEAARPRTRVPECHNSNQRYEAAPSRDDVSIFPFTFRPTLDDRKQALNHSGEVGSGPTLARSAWAPSAAMFILVMFILLVLVLRG